eukprot:2186107-Alexandrium_andersonii.AAC.1
MEEAWAWACGKVAGGKLSAAWARGPAATTLRTILDLGWGPKAASLWGCPPMPGRRSGADIDLARDAPVLVAKWARSAAQWRLWQE